MKTSQQEGQRLGDLAGCPPALVDVIHGRLLVISGVSIHLLKTKTRLALLEAPGGVRTGHSASAVLDRSGIRRRRGNYGNGLQTKREFVGLLEFRFEPGDSLLTGKLWGPGGW